MVGGDSTTYNQHLTLYARDANEQVMAIYERDTLFVFRSWLLPPTWKIATAIWNLVFEINY